MLLVRVPCRGALIGRRTPRPAPAVALYRVPTRSRDAASSTLTEGGVAREDAPVSLDAFVLFAEGKKSVKVSLMMESWKGICHVIFSLSVRDVGGQGCALLL